MKTHIRPGVLGAALALVAWPLWAINVTFQVNMSYLIEQERFDPAVDFVDLAGNFNGWGSSPPLPLSDEDSDSVYVITIGGFSEGQILEFKFRINGQWDGTEEFPGGGSNRVYEVLPDNNLIRVWYNNEEPPDPNAPLQADFWASNTSLFTQGVVLFQSTSTGPVEEWEWTFEGGKPGTWQEEVAPVYYETPGTYDVQLIVRGAGKADTLLLPDYIRVEARQSDQLHWWNERVFYEIFVRSFFDSDGDGTGDFQGLIQKLDYLNDGDPNTTDDLGISGIWLMPIHPSPTYHGYDVLDYRGINPDYGTMADFKAFLDAAHQRGIRVILDFVMNHSSSQHPWFLQAAQGDPHFRDFYIWSDTLPGYQGPWGQDVWHARNDEYYYGVFWSGMPDLNYHNPAVQDSMLAIADFWLEEVGVDGFRLDAIKHLFENGDQQEHQPETLVFLETLHDRIKQANPEAFAVGEVWSATEAVLPYVQEGRLDYCFEFDLANALLSAAGLERFEPVALAMQNAYNSYPHLQYGLFAANHDQNRIMSVLGEDPERAKLVASMYLLLPGIPYLYYGEEVGMIGTKPDPTIRTPMHWTSGTHAGFTSGTPWIAVQPNYTQYNVADQAAQPGSIWQRYQKLIRIRQQQPALQRGHYEPLFALNSDGIYAFRRQLDGEDILVVINLRAEAIEAPLLYQAGTAIQPGRYDVLDLWSNSTFQLEVDDFEFIQLEDLPPYALRVIKIGELVSTASPAAHLRETLLTVFPNPSAGPVEVRYVLPEAGAVSLRVLDAMGREVAHRAARWHAAGTHRLSWNLAEQPAGIYYFSLIGPAGIQTRKVVIRHGSKP